MVPEIIIACDVQDDIQFDLLVKETHSIPGVRGYKVGANLAILYGLKYISSIIYQYTGSKVLMYDHQKAGMDFPHIGEKFMRSVRLSGFDSVIFFPQAGKEVQAAWTRAAQYEGLVPIIGGKMTQWTTMNLKFGERTYFWEVYNQARFDGVEEFISPGNDMMSISIMSFLDSQRNVFYTPGIGAQGGTISKLKEYAPELSRVIPIVGRRIYESSDMAIATKEILSEME